MFCELAGRRRTYLPTLLRVYRLRYTNYLCLTFLPRALEEEYLLYVPFL